MAGAMHANGNGFNVPVPGDLDGHIAGFIADCEMRGMSPETIRSYRSNLRTWARFLHDRGRGADTSREGLESFLWHLRSERGLAQATMENYFAALSSFYKYLVYMDLVPINPVLPVRERYLRTYKKNGNNSSGAPRRVPTTEELSNLVRSIVSPRDRALVVLLAKTGVRRGELIAMDVDDIDWEEGSITLKDSFAKRTNRTVFLDEECARVLRRWVEVREKLNVRSPALFVGTNGTRLKRNGVYSLVIKHAERAGLHKPGSGKQNDHFGPHSLRYWFTHALMKAGMRREMVQELRGDQRRDAVDIYDRITRDELREAYLAHVPQLGV